MDCKLVRTHLDAYVDGELEPTPIIEFERHLDDCSGCRNELALMRLLKKGVREGAAVPKAPPSLMRRVGKALDGEEASLSEPHHGGRWAGGLAVAASVLIAIGAAVRSDDGAAGTGAPSLQQAGAATADPAHALSLLSDIVQRHRDQLPADIATDQPEQVANFFRGHVSFRVRSVDFGEPQVRFAGARVSHVGNQQAAKLYYDVGNRRVTMVVFRPPPQLSQVLRDDQVARTVGVRRQRVGSRVLTYQNVQGYTVPIIEEDGIVYAFTGDLDQQQMLRLAASVRLP